MKGFFSKEQTQTKGQMKGFSCASCGLYKYALTPKMLPYGNFKKKIMVIGEAPVHEDDRKGKPFHSRGGRLLQQKFKQLGINLFEDCISLNAVNCRPTDKKGADRGPTNQEIACCYPKVLQAIRKYQPKVIILQGGVPTQSLIGNRWGGEGGGIMKWQGWTIPDAEYNAWICPTFHPSFIERQDGESEAEVIWTKDLQRALSKLEEPLPDVPDEKNIIITDDIESVLTEMNAAAPCMMAFDIETTGLKPYDTKRHKIVSISFCNNPDHAYAIPFPTKKKHLQILEELLTNPEIKKIAANMKYENNWLKVICGVQVYPWKFDTMLAAHILDNRYGITGLKFQSYVNFGVTGYNDEVAPYLKAPDANSTNRIMELASTNEGMRKLLLYNGMDSLLEYRLAMRQLEMLGRRCKE
jgi:uracil-DNA glycosylase family 4